MDDSHESRSSPARRRYRELVAERPDWFANQSGGFEILLDDAEIDRAEASVWSLLQRDRAEGRAPAHASRAWVTVGVLAEDVYGVVLRDAVRTPDGKLRVYRREMTGPKRGQGVAILAYHEGRLILVEHHRHALRRFSWEIPRGFALSAETWEATAIRQIREEIGAVATDVIRIGAASPDGGRLGDTVCFVSAVVGAIGPMEAAEAIRAARFVSPAELKEMIRTGEITDGFTIAAFGLAAANGLPR